MKKIYITSHYLKHGGIEKMVCNLSNLFIEMNYDVEILCVYFDGEPVYYLNDKVKITYLTDKLPRKNNSLKESLKKFNFLGFINNSFVMFSQYRLHNKVVVDSIRNIEKSIIVTTRNEHTKLINKYSSASNKLIAQLHCDYSQYKGYLKDIKYRYNNIDYLLLLTEELKKEIEPELTELNKKTKCLTVPNFIKDTKDTKDIERKKQIISVGRLGIEKGFDRLLLIWKEFLVNNKDYILKIVGDGEEKESLIQLAKYLNISDSIIFTGFLSNDEAVEEIRKSKIYVMTSLQEALPMVLIESISKGTPIVAYDVRVGPRAIIEDGYNGFLVKENDIKTFVERLNFLLKENNFYNNMSKNAVNSSSLYSKERLKNIWFEILK